MTVIFRAVKPSIALGGLPAISVVLSALKMKQLEAVKLVKMIPRKKNIKDRRSSATLSKEMGPKGLDGRAWTILRGETVFKFLQSKDGVLRLKT